MKMAIIGAGNIARQMATTIREMPEVESYAIASRDLPRAQAFAAAYDIQKAYGSYLELVQDPAVDLIYVATPHSHHYDCVKLCLEHGKHVLCEKSFTVNAKQAKELLALSEAKGLLLAEAIWTRYVPMRQMILDTLNSGIVGECTSVWASLCYCSDHVERILEPALAGGALLDLGVYTVNFVSAFFGDDYQTLTSVPIISDKGVDAQNMYTYTYADGRMAIVHTSTKGFSDRGAIFNCRKGYVKVQNINNYEKITVYSSDHELLDTIDMPPQITGFEYEVQACMRAIEKGAYECEEMPHATILRMMEIMDGLRAQWGVVYPADL